MALVLKKLVTQGLESNNFLINNDIWLKILPYSDNGSTSSLLNVKRYNVSISNLTNGKTTVLVTAYPITPQSEVNVKLNELIKSTFSPVGNNINVIKINLQLLYFNSGLASRELSITDSITRNFIRGGKRTNEINNSLINGLTLSPTEKIAVWAGYPSSKYVLNGSEISQVLNDVSEFRTVKTCSPLYVKFLNQLGGYSYWLFEVPETTQSGRGIGFVERIGSVKDLGVSYDNSISAISKVPAYYLPLIQDLIISPDVSFWKDAKWNQLTMGNNSITENSNKKAYEVNVRFDKYDNLNPSLIW